MSDKSTPSSKKPVVVQHRGFTKINKPKFNPVFQYSPTEPNPDYKRKPIKPT